MNNSTLSRVIASTQRKRTRPSFFFGSPSSLFTSLVVVNGVESGFGGGKGVMEDFCRLFGTPARFSFKLSGDGFGKYYPRPLDWFRGTGMDSAAIDRKPALEPLAAFPRAVRVVGLACSQRPDERHGSSNSLAQTGGARLLTITSQAPDCGQSDAPEATDSNRARHRTGQCPLERVDASGSSGVESIPFRTASVRLAAAPLSLPCLLY